ncbi:hypothetical protein P8452_09938 [Trifolium repens]|nr:hypothetical protein P8452_09938 [Trifolium repens]
MVTYVPEKKEMKGKNHNKNLFIIKAQANSLHEFLFSKITHYSSTPIQSTFRKQQNYTSCFVCLGESLNHLFQRLHFDDTLQK